MPLADVDAETAARSGTCAGVCTATFEDASMAACRKVWQLQLSCFTL